MNSGPEVVTASGPLGDKEAVAAQMEEYKALYSLVVYRMTSLEQRLPLAGALIAAALSSVPSLPKATQTLALLGLPVVLFLILQSTVNHARSFEDVLRRIEDIEKDVNKIAKRTLLSFQSRHPSRHRAVGGRTGTLSVRWILITNLLLYGMALGLFWGLILPMRFFLGYSAFIAGMSVLSLAEVYMLSKYRYRKTGHDDSYVTIVSAETPQQPSKSVPLPSKPLSDHSLFRTWSKRIWRKSAK